jgi:hypothetical protein
MSECRALTNMIGNGLATVVVSRWEKEVTKEELNANLRKSKSVADFVPEDIEAEPQAGGKPRTANGSGTATVS